MEAKGENRTMTDTFELPSLEGLPEGPWIVDGLYVRTAETIYDDNIVAKATSPVVARAIAGIPDMKREIGTLLKEREAYRRVTGQLTIYPDAGTEIVERLYRQHFDNLPVGAALLMHEGGREIERMRKIHELNVIETRECDCLRAENAELLRVLDPLLDHYLHCYDGNYDQLATDARALLAKEQP